MKLICLSAILFLLAAFFVLLKNRSSVKRVTLVTPKQGMVFAHQPKPNAKPQIVRCQKCLTQQTAVPVDLYQMPAQNRDNDPTRHVEIAPISQRQPVFYCPACGAYLTPLKVA